jgi:hypothetical protein
MGAKASDVHQRRLVGLLLVGYVDVEKELKRQLFESGHL